MLCKGHIMCNSLVDAGFIKELKENHVSETYLRRNISCTLKNTFAKAINFWSKGEGGLSLKLNIVIDCARSAINITYKMNATHS